MHLKTYIGVQLLIAILRLIKICSAGSIQNYDILMDYSNIGYTSQYTFQFQVSTSTLDQQKDAIRIIFPNPIHDPSQSLSVSIQSATLTYQDNTVTPPQTVQLYATNMRVDTLGRYYFQFGQKFSSNLIYTLVIQATALGASLSQKLLTSNYILEFETIMDYTSDNSFIYDYNPNFAVIRYTSAPQRNVQFSVDATVSDQAFSPGGVYPIFFTIITSKSYYGNVKFEISFIPQGFQFTQFCYSVQDTQITAIEPSLYNCQFSNNKLVFYYNNQNIPSNFALKIATIAQNANRIEANVGFKLRVIQQQGSHITDEVSQENLFGLQQLFLTQTSINLSYGIPINTQLTPNFLICLIRNTNTVQGSSIFNAIKFIFQINQSTPIGQELELHFQVPSGTVTDTGSYVLVQSISENLPNLSKTQSVACTVVNNFSQTHQRYIKCINVGQILQGTVYHIGFRFYLSYDSAQSNLPNNFSQLDIFTVQYPNQVRTLDSTTINVKQTIATTQVRTVNANTWSYSYYNQTVVSTQPFDSITRAASFKRPYLSGGTLGIVAQSSPQKLIFSLDIPNGDLTTTNMTLSQTVPYSAGVQIAVNPQITFDVNTYVNSYSLLNQNISHSISYSNSLFTIIQVSASTTDALSKLFTRNDFSISPSTINFKTTPYATQNILDFYIMTYDQILGPTPVLGGYYLANSYTVDFSVQNQNYQLAIVNQYKGTTFGNIPSVVPTFLSLTISFLSSDISSGNQGFIIFFEGGSFLSDVSFQNNETKPQIIQCGSSILNTNTQYLGYGTLSSNTTNTISHGLIYQNMNQLVIKNFTLSAQTPVTIILPIQLNQYSDQFEVYVATFQIDQNYKQFQKSNYYQYDMIYRLSASSQNLVEANSNIHRRLIFGNQLSSLANFPNDSLFPTIQRNSFKFNNLNNIGSTVQMSIDLKFADSDPIQNNYKNDQQTTYLQGSAFTLIASWSFLSTQESQGCFYFGFSYNNTSTPPQTLQRYVMYCPISVTDTTSLQQSISNFLIPPTSTQTPSDTVFAISNAQGYLRYAYQFSQNIQNPNNILVTVLSAKLFWGSQDNLIQYQISQINSNIPFQSGMMVRIIQSFKSQYIIPGKQCLFYDPQSQVFEPACQVSINQNNLQIDFLLGNMCSYCTFKSTFVIYHYANQIITSGNNDNDKNFLTNLCLIYVSTQSNGNQCQLLANTPSPSSYTFQTTSSNPPPQKLNINSYQIKFQPQSQGQVGQFSLSFGFNYQSLASILFNANVFDRIVLNLGTFGVYNKQLFDSSINARICQIYQDNGNGNTQLTSLFSSLQYINSNSGGSLLLTIKQDLKDTNNFIFKCSNVIYPSATIVLPINIVIQDYLYTSVFQQSDNYQFASQFNPPNYFQIGYPFIQSILGNNQGSISSITFSIKTKSTQFLNGQSSIYITFPFNYDINGNLKYSFSCQVNSIRVDCFIDSWNTLRFSGIPQQTSNLLLVIVSGVSLAKYNYYAKFSFLVVFDYTNPNIFEEGVADSITESNLTTQPLIINSMQLSNTILDQLSSYTFYLTLNSTYITPTSQFQVNFPSIWKITNDENVSQCMIQNVDQNNILGQFCRREGSTVIFKIFSGSQEISQNQTSSSTLSTFLLYITNINNPEIWPSNIVFVKPSVSLVDTLTGATIYFGDSYLMNSNIINFQQINNTQYLGWFDSYGNQIYQVNAVNGVIQTQIFLRPLNTSLSFQGQISISLSDTSLQKLTIFPKTPVCSIGDTSLQVFIGGNSQTRQGSYIAMFYKVSDPFNLYSNIPSISKLHIIQIYHRKIKYKKKEINVMNQIVSVNYSVMKLKVPKNGISPPIIFDLSNQRIIDSITVQPVANSDIEVIQGAQMKFNSFNIQQVFQFQVNNNIVDSIFTISFSTFGPGSQFIQANSKINVELDLNSYQFTKLSIIIDSTKVTPTSQPVQFTCSNIGIIYYRISQLSQPAANVAHIQQQSLAQFSNFQDSYNLIEQYGYILSNGAMITVQMTNLSSLQQYKVEAYCQTYNGDSSDKVNAQFQTSDNGSLLNQFTIKFVSNLTDTQKRKLCCIVSEFLTIPSSLVYLREGSKCKSSQLRVNFINPQPLPNNTQSTSQAVVYIAPLNYLPDVSYFNYMAAAISNQKNFISILSTYIPSLPKIQSISNPVSIQYSAVSFDLSIPDQITIGQTNVTISNLKLKSNGFIYLALEELSANSIQPDPTQLQKGVNYQGTVFKNGMQIAYQNQQLYKQSSFYFDQLKNGTQYIIYFMGTSEFQDDKTSYTEVFTRQFQTLSLSISVTLTSLSEMLTCSHLFTLIFILIIFN
ncbi:hypothetical protein ABPG74_017139 [Tetrahymena malaccensis]